MISQIAHMICRFFSDPVASGLLLGDVLATLLVGIGIVLETPEKPTIRQKVAMAMVVVGVVAETVCSVWLFTHDASIIEGQNTRLVALSQETSSQQKEIGTQQDTIKSQNDKIIALEERLAARTLTGPDAKMIRSAVGKYAGEKFQAIPYWDDKESLDFANSVADVLISAGWVIDQPKQFTTIVGVVAGMDVYADPRSSSAVAARNTLVETLNKLDFATVGKDKSAAANTPVDNEISLSIGIKP